MSPSRPSAPGTITGSTPVCQNTAGLVYSVAPVANATSYTWTLPAGWSISSSSGTNSITVTSGVAGGTISVAAVNFCGSSDAPQSININPVSATNNTGWTDNNGPKTSMRSWSMMEEVKEGVSQIPIVFNPNRCNDQFFRIETDQ